LLSETLSNEVVDSGGVRMSPLQGGDMGEFLEEAKEAVRDLLEEVVRKEFIDAYGEKLWLKIISIKPKPSKPFWSLNNLFKLFDKHHIAVFGLVFPRNGNELKNKIGLVRCGLVSGAPVPQLLGDMVELVEVVRARASYQGRADITQDKLQGIREQLESGKVAKRESKSQHLSTISGEETGPASVQAVFQVLWAIIATFTRGFATVYSVSHSLAALEPEISFNSREDAANSLPGFFSAVSGLQGAMFKCVSRPEDQASLNSFHSLLTGFLPSLSLDTSYWGPVDTGMSKQALIQFITSRELRETLEMGLQQISDLRNILIDCIQSQESLESGEMEIAF